MIRPCAIAIAALFLVVPLSAAAAQAAPPRAVAMLPAGDGMIALFRPDKDERETFSYLDAKGRLDIHALDRIAHFFRCRLTEEVHAIDPELILTLDAISDRFGGKEVQVISGYRSPTRNALMRRQGRRVAKASLHMQGMAADIEISGVSAAAIRDLAWAFGRGGVGYYGSGTFVHIDTGPLRTWGWRPAATNRTASAAK